MLTESSINEEWSRLLRLITQTTGVHCLDTEYICITRSQAMDHKPARYIFSLILPIIY